MSRSLERGLIKKAQSEISHAPTVRSWVQGLLLAIFLAAAGFYAVFEPASAAVTACSASVSPSSVVRNNVVGLTFSISNTDSVAYNWIKVTRPSANFTINSGTSGGWSISANSTDVTFSGSTVPAGGSISPTVNVTSADTTADSASWTVQVSDDGGVSSFTCVGSLGVSITNDPNSSVQQSEITISDITSSSVKISWTTTRAASSELKYGVTDSYGSTKSSSDLASSHSYTIDGLTANTTYSFNAKNTDSGNNTAEAAGTFTTAAPGLTGKTVTVTKTVSPTPTPTPIPDTTPPAVKVNTDFSAPFETAPNITGSAYDASGVSKIEYSLDNGKSWIRIHFDNVGDINIRFDIKPESLEEDNYKVKFRAYDTKSNIGYSKTFDLVIDRLPPKVGGAMFSVGPQIIFPEKSGVLSILQNIEHSIVFSAIGGPIKIELFLNGKKFGVSKDKQSGLWIGKVKFEKAGKYSLIVKAEDGAGKKSEKKIADVNVVAPGKILDSKTGKELENAKITVYLLHPKSNRWVIWDGKQYSQNNPTISDKNGQSGLYLPAGKYYISISKAGYVTSVSEFFSLENPAILSAAILLTPKQKINIGPVSLYLPDLFFRNNYFPLKIINAVSGQNNNSLIGKEAPDFSLKTVSDKNFNLIAKRGAPLILTFVSSWSPSSLEQILVDEKTKNSGLEQIYLVDIQESMSKISIFQKRGEYSLDFIVDSDGVLVEPYNVNFLPMHFVLDRKGVVRNVISGVLNKQELENYLKDVAQY